jgi:hypothetical protein
MLLLEHHCPICDAASTCQGLCRTELELFQEALGDDVTVTRTQHVLSGDLRCAYRISPRPRRRRDRAGVGRAGSGVGVERLAPAQAPRPHTVASSRASACGRPGTSPPP